MKKKIIAALCTGLFLAVLLGNLQQPTYTYTVNEGSTEFNEWETQVLQTLLFGENQGFAPIYSSKTAAESPIYDAVYTINVSYPIGWDTTYVLIPYLRGRILDVPTAGYGDWTCEYGVAVMGWRGGKPIGVKELALDSTFTTTADDNTILDLEWPWKTTHVTGSHGVNAEENRLARWDSFHAVTVDSTQEENKPCVATLRWEGECAIPRTLLKPSVGMHFALEAKLPYGGNVKR